MTASKLNLGLLAAFGVGAIVSTAHAQWTVVNLHPAGATESLALGVSGGQQVGQSMVGGMTRASLWSGTAASWIDLNPPGSIGSSATSVSGGQQVGSATIGDVGHASVWNGTSASWVDLNPVQASCYAQDASDGQQVGYAMVSGANHASLWSGTAASWVDLHPGGEYQSFCSGTGGGQQVGWVVGSPQQNNYQHASLWSGTAASWVNLHPAMAFSSSCTAVDGGQQAGVVIFGDVDRVFCASLWSGTAESWVNLSPAGTTQSAVYGISGGQQVGYVLVNGTGHASLWSGTAASWVDLHTLLPAGFRESFALDVFNDGTFIHISGYGYNNLTARNEALMWKRPLCSEPSVTGQPSAQIVSCLGGVANFTVAAEGTGTLSFRWQIESLPSGSNVWADLDDGPVVRAGVPVGSGTGAGDNEYTFQSNQSNLDPLRFRCIVNDTCGSSVISEAAQLSIYTADLGAEGGVPGRDGAYDNNDFIVFIGYFFSQHPLGDRGRAGGEPGADGLYDNNDFIVFIDQFFAGC